MHRLWSTEPTGILKFTGTVESLSTFADTSFRDTSEPLHIEARWNPLLPNGIEGTISGPSDALGSVPVGGGEPYLGIHGQLGRYTEVWLEDAFINRATRPGAVRSVHAPYGNGEFQARRAWLYTASQAAETLAREITLLLPPHPVLAGLSGFFSGVDRSYQEATHQLSIETDHHLIRTTTLRFEGTSNYHGYPHRSTRAAVALRVVPRASPRDKPLPLAAEEAIEDCSTVLLLLSLAARARLQPLGGLAQGSHFAGQAGQVAEYLEWVDCYSRDQGRTSGIFEPALERAALVDFVQRAVTVLATDRDAKLIELAIEHHLVAWRTSLLEHRFLAACTGLEALREWKSRRDGLRTTARGSRASAFRASVREAIESHAAAGHLTQMAYSEAMAKLPELLRPRTETVLRMLVRDSRVQISDLLPADRNTGEPQLDFLKVRNRLVHRGSPGMEAGEFADLTYRTLYLLERLLFSVLGNTQRLRSQFVPPLPTGGT